jgi:hypothetical protein
LSHNVSALCQQVCGAGGIPLLRGRDFAAEDRAGTRHVAIVNRAFVRTYVPDRDPIGLTRLMSSLLFGVSARDPLTLAAVALLLVAVAVLAGLLPARRALRIDPVAALRWE